VSCGAKVGVHKGTKIPLGTLSDESPPKLTKNKMAKLGTQKGEFITSTLHAAP